MEPYRESKNEFTSIGHWFSTKATVGLYNWKKTKPLQQTVLGNWTYLYRRKKLKRINESNPVVCGEMKRKHYVKWNKPDAEEQTCPNCCVEVKTFMAKTKK